MDQSYGNGQLPMGGHYQYQDAVDKGLLFTDLNQLQPGDLVFIDTGWMGGAGAELNRAGHVGIYIGNGQMIHAANPNVGTIVSPISGYGSILGARHMGWSQGGAGYASMSQQQPMTLSQRIQQFMQQRY
jgi:cell wall-associated NlpC family hydrolase